MTFYSNLSKRGGWLMKAQWMFHKTKWSEQVSAVELLSASATIIYKVLFHVPLRKSPRKIADLKNLMFLTFYNEAFDATGISRILFQILNYLCIKL